MEEDLYKGLLMALLDLFRLGTYGFAYIDV